MLKLFPSYTHATEKQLVGDIDKLHKGVRKQRRKLALDRNSPYAVDLNDAAMTIVPGRGGSIFGRAPAEVVPAIGVGQPGVETIPSTPVKRRSSAPDVFSVPETGVTTPLHKPELQKELVEVKKQLKELVNSNLTPAERAKTAAGLKQREKDIKNRLYSLTVETHPIHSEHDMAGARKKLDMHAKQQEYIDELQSQVHSLLQNAPQTSAEQEQLEKLVKEKEAQLEQLRAEQQKKDQEHNIKEARVAMVDAERQRITPESGMWYLYNIETGEVQPLGTSTSVAGIKLSGFGRTVSSKALKASKVYDYTPPGKEEADAVVYKAGSVPAEQLNSAIEKSLKRRKLI